MSGHSKWSQIKHQKGITDQKRGKVFSKLLNAIAAAAKSDPNPQFNLRLRTAIEKAKTHNVPNENIERAVKRATEAQNDLEELVFEAYGPGGVAILVEAISDSKNRTVAEVKRILHDHESKWAETGSVRWAFEPTSDSEAVTWKAKFPQSIDESDKKKLRALIEDLEEHDDVQKVYTNVAS